ncbi:MAG TPA: VOC family protein [Segeticoccus sp.]|nr:VOC family protein [Segeticoccus sp.]
MITSVHTLIYSDDPPATRAFLRDVLGWAYTRDEASAPDWLIFSSGRSEVGVHPLTGGEGDPVRSQIHHELSLMCDDVAAAVAELKGKGAQFTGDVEDRGFGLAIQMVLPGAGHIQLYEPRHAVAYDL